MTSDIDFDADEYEDEVSIACARRARRREQLQGPTAQNSLKVGVRQQGGQLSYPGDVAAQKLVLFSRSRYIAIMCLIKNKIKGRSMRRRRHSTRF